MHVHASKHDNLYCTLCATVAIGVCACRFFKNIGLISMLVFFGTCISAAAVAFLMYGFGALQISVPIPLFHAGLFGAIVSAIDPITVLSLFGRLQTDTHLNSVVFGESVLNDAVSIVIYNVRS